MGRKRPEDRVTVQGTGPGRQTKTEFEQRWGIHVKDLARVEGVTPQSIIMRVHSFGTPFQRRRRPQAWEEKYGKTLAQLARERGVHPVTIHHRMRSYGSLDLPPDAKTREDLRDPAWMDTFEWEFSLKDTFFTLEDALQRLEKLKQQDKQDAINKDLGNDHGTTL